MVIDESTYPAAILKYPRIGGFEVLLSILNEGKVKLTLDRALTDNRSTRF